MQKQCEPTRSVRRTGFSFIEVLFAVMILGVGFILIAAMFPVAIQQTQAAVESVASRRVFFNAKSVIEAKKLDLVPASAASPVATTTLLADSTNRLRSGRVISFRDARPGLVANAYEIIRGHQIDLSNPRIAWVPLFKRDAEYDPAYASGSRPSSSATVIIIIAAVRNRPSYSYGDSDGSGHTINTDVLRCDASVGYAKDGTAPTLATLEPRLVDAAFITAADTSYVTFPTGTEGNIVAEGSYVIVSDDTTTPAANGSVFRVSSYDPATARWTLEPGSDLASTTTPPTTGSNVKAFVLGRGWDSINKPVNYEGAAQDVVVFSTSISGLPLPPAP